LAQAIVSLGRSAERRRGARANLIEATDTIANAIREELRSGDSVEVEGHQDFLTSLLSTAKVTYRASRATRRLAVGAGKPQDALIRESDTKRAVFGLDGVGEYDLGQPVGAIAHTASEDERQAFVHEVPAVVAAFNRLLEEQASRYESAAKKATKLTPR